MCYVLASFCTATLLARVKVMYSTVISLLKSVTLPGLFPLIISTTIIWHAKLLDVAYAFVRAVEPVGILFMLDVLN